MSAAQTELIVQGRHRDPFAYLGPHKGQIRAWLPQAKEAFVLAGGQVIPMKRANPAGLFTAKSDATDYRLRITLYSGESAGTGRSVSLPSPADAFRIAPARRRHQLRELRHAGGARGHLRRRGGCSLRGVGSECRGGQRHRRPQQLGSHAPSDASARRRPVGDFSSGTRGGRELQIFGDDAERPRAGSQRSLRILRRGAAQDGVDRLAADESPVGRRGVDGRSRETELAARAGVDVRSAPGILAARSAQRMADVSGAGREAAGVCGRERLHASGTAADHGASVFGIVGLPGDRLLRAHFALRDARRFPVFRRPLPSGRAGRDPGLGSRPFSEGSARSGALRRHGALTSMRIRGWASIATGERSSSTTAATRSASFCCRTRCTG